MVLDGSAEKSVELVEETDFGTFPTDPTMLGFGGYPTKVSNKNTVKTDRFGYLKAVEGTNRLQSTKVVKVGEAYGMSIELKPTDWAAWYYALGGGSVEVPAIGDTLIDFSVGQKIGAAEFEEFTGGIVQKIETTIEPDKTAITTLECLFAGNELSGSDYIGAGAHASVASGEPLDYEGISSITYDSDTLDSAGAELEYIKFGCEYAVKPVMDMESTLGSKIGAWGRSQRNIYFEMGLTLNSLTTLKADMFDGAAHGFIFTGLTKTLTFSNLIWDGDWTEDLDPEDIIAMPLKASNCDLVFS